MTPVTPRRPAVGGRRLPDPPAYTWPVPLPYSTAQWVPPSWTRTVACGEHFHAVRVRADIAAPALQLLGHGAGPVLAYDTVRAWWFLVPPGPVEPGLWAPGIRLLRPGTPIAVPPPYTTTGRDVRWIVTPEHDFTPLEQLRAVLTARPSRRSAGLAHRPPVKAARRQH
ncbi:hypothetical protein ACFY9A_36155 [Streptomyces rubradiris]|uniref:hypothetical protein n=1 Tax=Streptomyces rubradiris TaxID=285531 RepID=UPI0036E51541